MKKAITQIWQWMGSTNRTRRRNAFILILLTLGTIIAIAYSGAVQVQIQKVLGQ